MRVSFTSVAAFSTVVSQLVAGLQYHGADFSSLTLLTNSGQKYYDSSISSSAVPFETILSRHGVNLARIRIWVNTNDNSYSLNYGLALAKKAQAAGMQILVDLHYSSTWADPGHQSIPSGWPTTLSALNTQIYTYTQSVVQAFQNQGTPAAMVQIGNEINGGFLWPVGQISGSNYNSASQLLHSAATAVHSVSSSTKIMIHLADGWKLSSLQSWYKGIQIQGGFSMSDVDIMGFSMYPFYGTSATLSNLQNSLNTLANTYGKDIIIAETDWPAVCSGTSMSEPSVPISAAGQSTWVGSIRNVLNNVPNGHGKGIIYWEPGWIGNAGLGSSCSDALLVDSKGNVRTSIAMFNSNM
ncbi:glycoside hydrolase family 53 protein [Botryobasidium botryosum FD-172 SS1]|uniref:Arabinogalactan endo-beta-1,4-galactanase n=1 Tax=Botryobasidium botryosum (strain FD-172 SS1) TaxID=930990 RepID=A0A067MI79_BOTB1|nr:glycoside hydrolase family 53 protein [Botryobasidium botryosum FD-172 SS1]